MLCKPEHAAFASWITGWFNFLGQVAVTTSIKCVLNVVQLAHTLIDMCAVSRALPSYLLLRLLAHLLSQTLGRL